MSKIEIQVIEKIVSRADVGLKKYGVTVERKDYSPAKWLHELQCELLDGAVYAERLLLFLELFEDLDIDTVYALLKQIKNNGSPGQLVTLLQVLSTVDLDTAINELERTKKG